MDADNGLGTQGSEGMNSTITFTNTSSYSRLMMDRGTSQRPFIYRNSFESTKYSEDNPHKVKYTTGYGSVKGLHYRKYISLELLSENNFSLTFHKFYSQEIKNLIRSI